MKRYSVASRHSVGNPRTDRWSVPSGLRSRGPTTAAFGRESANSSSRSSAPGVSQASAFRNSAYMLEVARRPTFQPALSPRFPDSIRATSGWRSRTKATVPSPEPLSTTTVSTPRSESRQFSIHGSASYVTTTAAMRGDGSAMTDLGPRPAPQPVAQHDQRSGEGHQQRHEEVEEARRERLVRAHAHAAEEADEERLPHRQPVQRERDEHDEEEKRPEDVVDARVELDPDRLRRGPDGQDADSLYGERHREHLPEQARVSAVVVDPLVEVPERLLEPDPS